MRRPVVIVMSGLTVAVLAVSLRSSERGRTEALRNAAPVGVVTPATGPSYRASASPLLPAPHPSGPTPLRSPLPPARPKATRAAAAPRSSRPVTRPLKPPTPSARPVPTTTVNGAPVDTQYGPVQVQISVRGHRIIRADAIVYPQGSSRDQEINSQAIPQLDNETLRAQSGQIDTVSGASYTSDGYRASLQSALDAAHRAGAL